jgi:radical SAM protein with 4Fe4S-binding SPASM domain
MTDKQKNIDSIYSDNGYARVRLADKLPLQTPFSVDYFLINACNLRCVFCGYSSPLEKYKHHQRLALDIDLFKKSIDDLKAFPDKIKAIHFLGYGEPLLHEKLPEMVAYAVQSQVAEKVDVITNGTLLTNKISNDLIAAKLDWLRISVNGISADDYKKNCGANIDFANFLDNITYFYNNRQKTKLYIKIFDYMVADEKSKKTFYDLFEPICDALSIEHVGAYVEGIDFNTISREITGLSTRGAKMPEQKICPMPFYMLRINPDGNCTPCCELMLNFSLGNISETSLPDIWNGKKFDRFRYAMLGGVNNTDGVCNGCKIFKHATCPEDLLDSDVNRLKPIYASE